MSVQNKEIKSYYREISKLLPGSAKVKKRIMESLHQSVRNYLEENPQADMADVQSHFGTPSSIAASYVEQMDAGEVIKKFDIKKTMIGVVCGTLLLAILMWGVGLATTLIREKKSADGYYEIDPIVEVETEVTQ